MKHLFNFNKSQSSFEMLIIFGFSFLLIILIGGYYIQFSATATSQIDVSQKNKIFTDIMDKSTRIFYQGNGNRVTVNAQLPDSITSMTIETRNNGTVDFDYLNITYDDNKQTRSSLYFPNELFVRLNCSTSCFDNGTNWVFHEEFNSQGPKQVRIESRGDYVLIDFVRFEG